MKTYCLYCAQEYDSDRSGTPPRWIPLCERCERAFRVGALVAFAGGIWLAIW